MSFPINGWSWKHGSEPCNYSHTKEEEKKQNDDKYYHPFTHVLLGTISSNYVTSSKHCNSFQDLSVKPYLYVTRVATCRGDTSPYDMRVRLTGKLANLVFRHLWATQLNCLDWHDSRRAEHGKTAEEPWPEGTTFRARPRRLQPPHQL